MFEKLVHFAVKDATCTKKKENVYTNYRKGLDPLMGSCTRQNPGVYCGKFY